MYGSCSSGVSETPPSALDHGIDEAKWVAVTECFWKGVDAMRGGGNYIFTLR